MPYIKYISLDSSFRNRVQFPLPAQFTVSMGCPSSILSPVSSQTPVYPLPIPVGSSGLEVQPIAFVQPFPIPGNTTDEWLYLPYLYCVDDFSNCTRFRLDPLVLQSITLNDLSAVQASNDFPLGTIPLERADNAYIGRTLEVMRDPAYTPEYRTIISSSYSETETILQSFQITECYINSGKTFFRAPLLFEDQLPSDIYRYYVGKYLKVDGTNYLITGSEVSSFVITAQVVTLTIDTALESKPTPPFDVSVVALENWFVEVDRPFTTTPSAYPSYRDVLVVPNTYTDTIGDTRLSNQYHAHDVIVLADGMTYGMVVQEAGELTFYNSTDTTGTEYSDVGNITLPTAIGGMTSGRVTGISLTLIGGNPAVAFTVTLPDETDYGLYYAQASNTTGSAWNTAVMVDTVSTSGTVALVPNPDTTFGTVGNPLLLYSDSADLITYGINTALDGSGAWTTASTGLSGQLLDANVAYFGTGGASYDDGVGLLYNETGGDLRFTLYNPTPYSFTTTVSTTSADEGVVVSIITDTAVAPTFTDESMPYIAYRQGTDLYAQAYAPEETGGAITTVTTSPPVLLYSGISAFDAVQLGTTADVPLSGASLDGTINGATYFTVLVSDQLFSFQSALQNMTVSTATSSFFTTRAVTNDIKILNPLTSGAFLPYVTASSNLSISSYDPPPTVITGREPSYYRIRDGTPITTGQNDLTAVNSTTLSLPSTESVSECDYIWVANLPATTTPTVGDFQMYNDIRKVLTVNRISNTITLNSPLSADINTFGPNNPYRWEIWSNITDSYYPLEFVGETSLVQQAVCYYIRLITLTLPNITLSVGDGKLIADYPYVYVQFESQSISHRSVIISNNPNSRRVLFKVPITNLVSPDRSTYVNLSGGSMEHIIAFTPMDSFIFSILLPTGEVFQTLRQDRPSPFTVDDSLQVSATFQVKLATDYYEEQG